ncbi:MAG: hypothetical protein J0I06_02710 [Planctomycetes bacterium]|nr:hypothetical protein [Planctomycetota bacterium]
MLRAIRLVLSAAAVLVGGALLAQPKGTSADGYFPLKLKSKWTYKVGDNFVDVTVVKMDKVGAEEHYQLDTIVGKDPKTSETVVVRPDGVYRLRVKEDKLDPPLKVLALPVKKDASWDINSKLGAQTIKGTLKVKSDKEKVKLKGPNGDVEYDTVFVEGENMDIAGAKTTMRIWFAKDRGIVKEEVNIQGGEKVLLELFKYEEGK